MFWLQWFFTNQLVLFRRINMIFNFLCDVLYIVVCPYVLFYLVMVLSVLNYGFWFPLWYLQIVFLFLKSMLKLRVFNIWESFHCIILKYYSLSYDLFKTMSRIGHNMIGDTDDGHGYPYEHPFSLIVLQKLNFKIIFIRYHSTLA